MIDLARQIVQLSPEKRRLLLQMLEQQGVDLERVLILPQAGDGGALPVSFAQERLWFLEQLEPGAAVYNIPAVVRLSGSLNRTVLERCLNEIIRRHDILRTTFAERDGAPVQIVAPALTLSIASDDLTSVPSAEREAQAMRLAREEAGVPFDIRKGPLLRARLLRLSEYDHVAVLTMHHIIADGWSMGVLLQELATLYAAYASDRPSPLPELFIQYADFARWQRAWLSGDLRQSQLAYWQEQLGGSPPALDLPTDRPRPPTQSYRGATASFKLPKVLAEGLTSLCNQEGATLFMALLAAFQTLLYRHSGQEDICIGTPIANRTRSEVEPLIGFFVNTLVLRADLSGEPSFRTLLRRAKQTTEAAYDHQDLPFEMLVEALQPKRTASHAPLFQVMFALNNVPMRPLALPGLTMTVLDASSGTAKFDLTLSMVDEPDGLAGAIEYATDLFDAPTIERMIGRFGALLSGIVADPDQSIALLPILTSSERRQILVDWNQTAAEFPAPVQPNSTIHDQFARQAQQTPNALAVVYQDQSLTFAELNTRANRIAHHLRTLGVGPETLVGLCLERSLDLVACVLGILKAGAAYLPLDPAYPRDRLVFMVEDSRATVLLTQEHLVGILPAQDRAVVCLDRDWPDIARQSADNPEGGAQATNAAYVIYTSGSTGKPKGVIIEHQAALNLAAGLQRTIYLPYAGRPLRITLNAPLSFDASVQQIVMLIYGHTMHVLPDDVRRDGPALREYLRRHRLEVVDCVPSQLKMLLAAGLLDGSGWMPPIMLPGGEAIDEATWQTLAGAPHTRFYNMYGPTECAVDSTTACANDYPHRPVIGRPMDNRTVYILDKHGQPAPIGVAGELYIGGAGVGRGYLQRPELTAERFVVDPFSSQPGARLYKSGDRARYLPDGNIEFLGRMDNQVKLRGYRIELGEIEALLSQQPAVQQAVVIVREDRPGDQRLAAYLVARQNSEIDLVQARAALKAALPDYMIPSVFIILPALPMTPNAKIDRRALPAPDQTESGAGNVYLAARTPTEEIVAGIWSQVLGVERVGAGDSFFDLGGHSLLATQVMSRVREALHVEVPLRILFESPTLGDLAAAIDNARLTKEGIQTPPIRSAPRAGDLPLSFAQQRLWFLDQLDPDSALYVIPAAVRLRGRLDIVALHSSLNEIVRRHESLRTVFAKSADGKAAQVIKPTLTIAFPVDDLSRLSPGEREAEAMRLAALEAQHPFDLAKGPLLRARLLRMADDEHIALFTMHHIISDGWSMGILVAEVAALYTALTTGQPAALAQLPVQYADFALWQRDWLKGAVLDAQIAFWKQHLSDAPPLLNLPTDRPRPAVQTVRGAHITFGVELDLSRRIQALARAGNATLFMALLAAFQAFLSRYSGQDDICVGTPIANRTRAELEGLIGFFVNTLVMRGDLSGDPSFRELLGRVRQAALAAYAHQDVPFEMLVDAIQPQRSLSQTPLFQAMFVLQNAPARAIQTPGLALEPLEVESGLSMFDLTLTMSETPSGLTGALEYNSDLFDAATAQRFLRHFRTLLEHIVDSPDVPLSRLPMLSAEERRQLLYTWNDTQTSYPSDKCIHQLVEEQAARTPGALAVIAPAQGEGRDRERTLTYSELNRRANCLAYYLRRLGAGPEVMVGICLERSLDLMVGLLGVLKAGSAYVPLDPAYPQERLAYMLADARLPLLLTHRGLDRRLPANSAAVVRLDADWPAIAQESEENPMIAIQPENLAYVIYTSGSTGKPKGVQVPHRGVVNHNAFMVKTMGITAADRVLQFATINFDTAAEEIYPTWYTGATLVLRPAGELLTAADLLQLVEAERITILDFPTAYWHEWVYELALLQRPLPPSLRLVIVGGEKASAERYALWQKLAGKVAWLNGYGPTEGTIIGALYDPTVDAMPNSRFEIPIGRPIANDQIYLLDRHMEPVPIGVAGDLHIGGAGVARGYLNHPDLTAERFVVDPFAADPGVRLYKTGDLGRYRADGQIEYVGRADGQVKIRGFRIELGEIEAALSQHQAVREAVALARDGETPLAPQRLVAYVVLATPGVTPGDLRSYLAGKLPDYMVPSAIVLLDALPLMPNGKVDRRALPAPDRTALATGTTYVAPRTQAEEVLARIWGQVLGREQVSVRDNFFELGGDSILSIQVIARANQAGLILTPKQLFQYPTIEGLAQVAGSGRAVQAEQDTVTGPVPLTPIQHWFFEQNLAEPHHFNQSLLLAVRDGIAPAALQAAFDHLQAHHDALRLRFLPLAANWQQEIAGPGQSTQLLRFDLSAMAAADQDAALFANSARIQASLNLTEGPLLQVALFDLGAQRGTRLFITIHHLAVDGVSWRILLEDLLAAYTQLTSGQSVALPPKTTSFKAWAERLAAHARSDALRSELAHWLAIGGCTIPRLPVDSLGDNTEASARDVVVSLSQEDTTALLYDVPPVYGTEINDVLLASLALAHSRWTGSPHLLLDLEGHGREALFDDVDLSRTVGWFTTVYPVLLTVQPQAGPGAVLKSIKEQARRVPQRGLGFGLLRYLTPDGETARLLSALPQPQISFNYLGQFDQAIPEGSPFTLAVEATGPDRSVRERRSHLIDVSAGVAGGRLQIAWTYSQNVHQRDTIECLAQDYLAQLQAIIRHCQSPTAGGYTPSDFPLLRKVSQDKLDRMLAKYRSKDRVSP